MKILMKPIEVIAHFKDTYPIPLRCRIVNEDNNIVIRVDKVIYQEEEKLGGNRLIVYRCQSIMGNTEKIYELKYEINTCKWFLFKM